MRCAVRVDGSSKGTYMQVLPVMRIPWTQEGDDPTLNRHVVLAYRLHAEAPLPHEGVGEYDNAGFPKGRFNNVWTSSFCARPNDRGDILTKDDTPDILLLLSYPKIFHMKGGKYDNAGFPKGREAYQRRFLPSVRVRVVKETYLLKMTHQRFYIVVY